MKIESLQDFIDAGISKELFIELLKESTETYYNEKCEKIYVGVPIMSMGRPAPVIGTPVRVKPYIANERTYFKNIDERQYGYYKQWSTNTGVTLSPEDSQKLLWEYGIQIRHSEIRERVGYKPYAYADAE